MDHAEVRDRLEGALLSPGKLYAIDTDATEAGEELRAHLASCAACRAELGALRETAALLAAAAPDDLVAPAEARERVLQAVRETGVVRARRTDPGRIRAGAAGRPSEATTAASSGSRRFTLPALRRGRLMPFPRLAEVAVAAAVVLLVGALVAVDLIGQRDRSAQQVRELSRITGAADRLLREPGTRDLSLMARDGKPAGTLIYNPRSGELVVVTDALSAPPTGSRYGCYLERGGERTQIGLLRQSGGLTYWTGKMQAPTGAGRSGDRFMVSLDTQENEPLLVAEF
jgi:hypothetical protein